MRTINMPPGLGDGVWILQKLINANERFIFRIPGGDPQRGKQLYDLLPQVSEKAFYDKTLKFRNVKNENVGHGKWADIKREEMSLEANTHLEQGKRIEKFLPDLPTSYTLPYQTTDKQKAKAKEILRGVKNTIGIYCSTYSGSRNWGTWALAEWLELIELFGTGYTFVVIGAEYDDLTMFLYWQLHEKKIPAINTVGQDLGTVIEILKRLDYFIGFPSGLSIINETLGKDGVMFLADVPQHIGENRWTINDEGKKVRMRVGGLMNNWADPKRIKNGNIKECLFCAPQQIFNWIKENKKL